MNYEPFTSIENPIIYVPIRHLYICKESSTNQPFYAKQTQFPKSQMNVNTYNTTEYENKRNWTFGQSKPNSNPIKPNCLKAKMDVTIYDIKDYERNDIFAVLENKPNSNPNKPNLETAPGQKVLLVDYGVLVNWLNGELINWNESNPGPLFYDSAYSQLPASSYSQSMALDCSHFLTADHSLWRL